MDGRVPFLIGLPLLPQTLITFLVISKRMCENE